MSIPKKQKQNNMMFDLKELITRYLYTLQSIQEWRRDTGLTTPYGLETQRCNIHEYIVLCLMDILPENLVDFLDVYNRSKEIFSNLDEVSTGDEWMLETDGDINHMANSLYDFLTSKETLLYLEGCKENCF